jgi:hypothetical protein
MKVGEKRISLFLFNLTLLRQSDGEQSNRIPFGRGNLLGWVAKAVAITEIGSFLWLRDWTRSDLSRADKA